MEAGEALVTRQTGSPDRSIRLFIHTNAVFFHDGEMVSAALAWSCSCPPCGGCRTGVPK